MSKRWLVLCILLVSHAGLLAWSASQHSPTLNEPGLLAAGLSHWQLERFELYRVNPPLVRGVACLPLISSGAKTDWSAFYEGPGARPEFVIGADFVNANGPRTIRLTTLARWACLPFSVLGALACYAWARELYGPDAGLLATMLWCFSPTILGHAALATTDAPTAAFAATASYCFWNWIKCPSWKGAIVSGIVLGLAELTKMTLLVLYPLWAVLWLTRCESPSVAGSARTRRREGVMLCAVFLVSLYVVNLGYLFEGSCTRLGEFQFVSDTLSGNAETKPGNRFSGSWLGAVPVPLPKNYVLGIDVQRRDFEHSKMPSYLRARFQSGGWWYYYLYALTVKVPLGTWGLLFVTAFLRATKLLRGPADGAEVFLLAPAAVILCFVSSQSGFSQHSRYVIPVLPFVFIWISQAAPTISLGLFKSGVACAALFAWSVASSLWYYPHSLSYFNELAGGPDGGHRHLLGSDFDWGQDLLYLKKWLDRQPDAKPMYISCAAMFDPKALGIDCLDALQQCLSGAGDRRSLLPGWYAISINDLCRWRAIIDGAYRGRYDGRPCALYELSRRRPAARIGYTIYLFHVRDPDGHGWQ